MSRARVPHNRLTHGEEEALAAAEAVRSGWWTDGPRTLALESALADLAGVEHAVCVGSGLAALRLSLLALGVEVGDRIAMPAYSCVALPNAALACGAAPVPVEITAGDWNIDLSSSSLEGVKAVIAVDTFGAPVKVPGGSSARAIDVIEDCSHAFGASSDGLRLGGRTRLSVLSLHATKLLGAGEGGAVLTRDGALAAFIRERRDYADAPADGRRLNDKMTELSAAVALAQLARLPAMLKARARLARRYHDRLQPGASGRFVLPDPDADRVWYRYAVEVKGCCAHDVVARLNAAGVTAAQPVTDWREVAAPSVSSELAAPVTDHAYDTLVSLPLYPTLTLDEQEQVIHAFLEVCAPER